MVWSHEMKMFMKMKMKMKMKWNENGLGNECGQSRESMKDEWVAL
jgi:hypothetical protein